uniref:Uncharacterized protein n=1 Tax=Lepeophtheirus salmonis TaxID=72036 RepID=A0A0K2UM37_LEPSM
MYFLFRSEYKREMLCSSLFLLAWKNSMFGNCVGVAEYFEGS